TSADLDYLSTTALALNGGTIRDTAGNDATLTLATPGAANSLGANKDIVIDTTLPTVSGVTSSTANGAYKVGDVIAVQVNFSEAVTVTGTPQLTLETGTTDRALNYASGTGTSTLTFNYTVQAGDTTADLDYLSTGALALNGGTIKDAAGNNATLTLAAPGAANSLGANKDLVVDGVVPTVSGVTSSTADGSYTFGDVIAIQVNFSENVTVTGTPQLTLETGSTDRVVNYASGSGSSTLVFNYTVQLGDTAADLDYISTGALSLNGGTVKDAAGNNATLTLASPGAANSLGNNKALVIDGVVPTVSGVTSSTADGAYKVGDVIAIQVNFSENVTVTGTPQLTLETGTTDRRLNYASGTGSSTLVFNYTVQAGDTSADLDYISTSALALNGGTIKDASGNNAVLTLATPGAANSLGANKAIVIDAVVPTVSGVTSSTANGAYKVGDVISIQVNFSEAVAVTGTPQLTLETGATDRTLNYASGTGTNALTFTYTVQAGDTSADLDYISASALALNGGTIQDAAGNNATLTLASPGAANSLGANKAIVIDTAVPTVSGVTSSTADGAYKAGDVISVQVNFSEAVNVTGTPQLTLETGTTDRTLNYASGTGTSTLAFTYTVQAGDTTADLDYISTGALALNGGTIKDAAGNNATLTLAAPGAANSLGANKAIVIDTAVPTVSGVTSTTTNGAYNAGDVISIAVSFSEAVSVTGTPQLTLETGTTDRVVNYASGTGSSTLVFSYTVQAGDTSADLDYLSTTALALNGGTIKDVAGNNATLTLATPGTANSLGANKAIRVDTTAPVVTDVTSPKADGTYTEGEIINIRVSVNEVLSISGTPQLQLETGATDRIASLSSYTTFDNGNGTGSTSLYFAYTVQAGDATADLDYLSTSALTLNGGSLRDSAGNDLVLTLPAPGAAGSLGANKNIVIDAVQPAVTGVTSSTANGTYKIGDVISIQVNFSEAVTVTGTPQLLLETGTVDRTIDYVSGSGTGTLNFSYTVQAGDTSADLNYLSTAALTLNGGTIQDGIANDAVLTLPGLAAAGALGTNKNIVIDGVVPTVTAVTSSTADGGYKAGDVISIQVGFSEAVTVTGTPQLTLETGTTDRAVNYASGSGSNTLTFTYTVQAGDTTADLDYIGTGALALNGGTIADVAGNNATLTLAAPGAANSLGANKAIVIDTAVPTVSGVTSSTANGAYKVGDVISVQVNFSEAVNVTGTPQLTLET
ncbi:hypothetical protein, partial [Ramlibacter sp.]|uniref:beta strand repeat-containing protein n=1 Tax=Ramlibacter sp. TaxID=1917967 RepID=UPI00184D9463